MTSCAALWILCVCFSALQTAALRVAVTESRVTVVQGGVAVLPCSFFTSGPLARLNVIWTLAPFSSPGTPTQVIVYDHGQVIEDPSFSGRVAFTGIPWSADIVVNDTRVSDGGTYRCMINNPPETADPGIGELELRVQAPPSLPVCRRDGGVELGGRVTLACSVLEGEPSPEIHWDKMSPQEPTPPIAMEGSVQVVNVSSQTSGLYRCSARNLLGTEHCYVNLSLSTRPDSSSGLLQAALLTLSMSSVLMALLALALWLHRTGQDGRRREGREEEEEEEEEESSNEIRCTPSLMKRSFV